MRFFKRTISIVLGLILMLSLLPAAEAKTGSYTYNSGTRHELCTALSSQARAYYTGSYAYDSVSALSASASDPMHSAMFSRLHTLMDSTMTNSVSYSSLTSYWKKTDANNGSSNPILFYSDELSGSYNREHVWPKSRGSFYQKNAGCDLHHLRPTNADANSARSNYTMGYVKNKVSGYDAFAYGDKVVLWYSKAADRVEVMDSVKGDVARILLYVWCRWEQPNLYENDPNPTVDDSDGNNGDKVNNRNDGKKVIESLATLLQWMKDDPVDTWEMSRNDQCENVQGNRNVFIDYPEYAWLLFDQTPPAEYQTPSGKAASASPKPTATSTATPAPTATPTATPKPTATPTPKPTATPTPKPTATPTPKPTATLAPVTPPASGDYVLHIGGGGIAEHTETHNGVPCLRVDVTLDGATEALPLSSLSFDLSYDPALLFVQDYVAIEGMDGYVNTNETGVIRYASISLNGLAIDANTPILTLYFALSEAGQQAGQIDFGFCGNFDASSVDPVTHGTVLCTLGAVNHPYLKSVLYGDANCDGRVTAADAAFVLRSVVGLSALSEVGRANACVTNAQEPGAADAAVILRYVVGLLDRLPAN